MGGPQHFTPWKTQIENRIVRVIPINQLPDHIAIDPERKHAAHYPNGAAFVLGEPGDLRNLEVVPERVGAESGMSSVGTGYRRLLSWFWYRCARAHELRDSVERVEVSIDERDGWPLSGSKRRGVSVPK